MENEQNVTESEQLLLERIRQGEQAFGPEFERSLDRLEANGEIEILQKHRESTSGHNLIDRILVRLES